MPVPDPQVHARRKVIAMSSVSIKRNSGMLSRRSAGLVGVVVFHALLIYALVTGLAQGWSR